MAGDICKATPFAPHLPLPPPSSFNLASFPPLKSLMLVLGSEVLCLYRSFLRDCILVFKGFPGGAEVKASACNVGDLGSIPGLGRSPGEGNGNPLQYSCLENPMDGGAWWATFHGSQRVGHDSVTSLYSNSMFNIWSTSKLFCKVGIPIWLPTSSV